MHNSDIAQRSCNTIQCLQKLRVLAGMELTSQEQVYLVYTGHVTSSLPYTNTRYTLGLTTTNYIA